METDLVKMSPKGQLVVPQDIRMKEGFATGDRFVPFPVKGGILFKKVEMPNVKAEFHKLSQEIEKQFKKQKVSPEDVDEAVKWARQDFPRYKHSHLCSWLERKTQSDF